MKESELTFGQRHGYYSIPTKLKLTELPKTERTAIWNVFCRNVPIESDKLDILFNRQPSLWVDVLKQTHEELFRGRIDRFTLDMMWSLVDRFIMSRQYWEVFTLIEYVMRHPQCSDDFKSDMSKCFQKSRLAYSISLVNRPTIVPTVSPEAAEAILHSFEAMKKAEQVGGIQHLEKASERINAEDHAGAVRESIHAVESVARTLDPKASKSLKSALAALEGRRGLHQALKVGMLKLYGYTCDEQGIRHALLDKPEAEVGSEEAVFMFGACAVFCGYLVSKRAEAPSE